MDIVIPWVDGCDPKHQKKREQYLPHQQELLDEAVMPHRWADNGELLFCLKSIQVHAPWAGRIFLITDNQIPRFKGLSWRMMRKIEVIDHATIFRGHEHVLPTFNSLSISSMAWRIQGLSDEFVLMNDDLFFCSRVQPTDFFRDGSPVIRGSWKLISDAQHRGIHKLAQIKASRLAGWSGEEFFSAAHVAHSISRPTMERLYDEMRPEFERNIAFRFRDPTQFSSSTLHAHVAIRDDRFSQPAEPDWFSISSGKSRVSEAKKLRKSIRQLQGMKMGCVNDMAAVKETLPDFERRLYRAIGIDKLSVMVGWVRSITGRFR